MPTFISQSIIGDQLNVSAALICTLVSIVLGIGIAAIYMVKNKHSKGLVVTIALMPTIVQVVIMLVNGNIGTGVAVMGAFSLVRFRSVPGSARDICSIFFAMAIGLATGMGYVFYAFLFFVLIGIVTLLLTVLPFGKDSSEERHLRIVIPESLDYEGIFDDLFEQYTTSAELVKVKTTNMGTMFELSYTVKLKGENIPKAFIDEIRCRNGNLNIIFSRPLVSKEEL